LNKILPIILVVLFSSNVFAERKEMTGQEYINERKAYEDFHKLDERSLIEETSSIISTTGDIIMFPFKVVGYTALIAGAIVTAPIWLLMDSNKPNNLYKAKPKTYNRKKGIDINLDFLDTPSDREDEPPDWAKSGGADG